MWGFPISTYGISPQSARAYLCTALEMVVFPSSPITRPTELMAAPLNNCTLKPP
ncbi:hypothetical protein M413DRAFT_449664 [Hebeloma cylindrosporum]|uniref:Uncharacterized protein n=1 Tax=Hebeloma cylindrosporum TaxID=76867 RepID=A0A0C3BU88_HEBCY|nr:hypothetical protein M413DRAFT_449664 [Hebeloma cylindrosporum h7]